MPKSKTEKTEDKEVKKTEENGEEQDGKGLLTQLNNYLSAGVHIGTKFKTKFMADYIFKSREDGLTILNVQKIDKRIRTAARFLAQFEPEQILVVGRRDSARKPSSVFAKITGSVAMPGRYYPGTLTNPSLPNYHESKVLLASDPWSDKNAVNDAFKSNIPIIALADSNNSTQKIDLVIPCNNKGKKSLATVYFLLAREYLKIKGLIKKKSEFTYKIADFMEEKVKE